MKTALILISLAVTSIHAADISNEYFIGKTVAQMAEVGGNGNTKEYFSKSDNLQLILNAYDLANPKISSEDVINKLKSMRDDALQQMSGKQVIINPAAKIEGGITYNAFDPANKVAMKIWITIKGNRSYMLCLYKYDSENQNADGYFTLGEFK